MGRIYLFLFFMLLCWIGGITGSEINHYLGVQIQGNPLAITGHVLYYELWGALTLMILQFIMKG